MQFKHPEILFALFLLIIPIIVHLFQLRRFQKVPFTNVQFLKEVELQTRKSANLKKWLILMTRLLLFTALIFAFAQPYFSKNKLEKSKLSHIYLDNSLSMQAQGPSGELFQRAVQEIISEGNDLGTVNLYTNDATYLNLNDKDLKNTLQNLSYSANVLDLNSVILKMNTDPGQQENIILISDFQNNLETDIAIDSIDQYFISQLRPTNASNVSIDSVYLANQDNETMTLTVVLHNEQSTAKDISISLVNNENMLVGKSTVSFSTPLQKTSFDIPNSNEFLGKFSIEDGNLPFDNQLYVAIQKPKKVKVTAIGDRNQFMERIYSEDEFEFTSSPLTGLDFNQISEQHLIVLNEVNPTAPLSSALKDFVNKGGDLVIIPPKEANINQLNTLFSQLNIGQIKALYPSPLSITTIHFGHPLLKGVFEKEIDNFQYPSAEINYRGTLRNASDVVSFENGYAFITQVGQQQGKVYWIASPISAGNANFLNSPLVVPIFYNFGIFSHQPSALYYTIGTPNTIEIDVALKKDEVVHLVNAEEDYIPLQQIHKQKVSLQTENEPSTSGFTSVIANDQVLKTLAFNHDRSESILAYKDAQLLFGDAKNLNYTNAVKNSLNNLNDAFETNNLWKLFLGLTLLFLLIEILLLKSKL